MPIACVITRHFPPLSSAGASIRLVKFIKYISTRDWKFIILTQSADQPVVREARISAFLEKEIPPETKVIRIPAPKSINPFFFRLLPETSLWWGLRVLLKGLRYFKEWQIDLFYAVTPVFTNALIGILLSWITRKPLVLDFKDDWVGSPTFLVKPVWRRKIETWLESWIVRKAARVILVTQQSYELYRTRYAKLKDNNKFCFIPNGCDLNEYLLLKKREKEQPSGKIIIMTAAWGYQKDYRDITPFFLALDKFIKLNPLAKNQVEVIFLGDSLSHEYAGLITEMGFQNIIKVMNTVNRDQLVEWLWKADLLFLVQPIGNTTGISGTLYEYWAVGKAPILLIAEQGASTRLVEEYNLGKSFHFDDTIGICAFISEIYHQLQSKTPIMIRSDGVELFDRRRLAMQMAEIWEKALPG